MPPYLWNPVPRKIRGTTSKVPPVMARPAYVSSIADFDRADEFRMDDVLESAVDQLEAQAKNPKPMTLSDLIVRFGELGFHQTARFDFRPPRPCKNWPGPSHGDFPLHEAISVRTRTAAVARTGSKIMARAKHPRCMKKKTIRSVPPQSRPSASPRDPSLTLLGLPAEIRNAIWSLIVLSDKPIEAHVREICPLKKKRNRVLMRALPREPLVSAVNRQIRKESLSLFYGSNAFVFEKPDFRGTKGHSMTDVANVKRWAQGRDFASYLSQVDLRFVAYAHSGSEKESYPHFVYRLRRVDCTTNLKIAVKTTSGKKLKLCVCSESVSFSNDKNLLEAAIEVLEQRLVRFLKPGGRPLTEKYIDNEDVKCEMCEMPKVRRIWSGI
ncbi:Hypothetical predicted protein [Lecanosticta acicola]|uniref:Uncharacterized protein n=1 Tax=Lecanosticta acicola TaxID=111012 RepID=A0AAI8Z6A1_9PEZI|nr:Hypothetical predicted protein [Lecanosticta acicola]